MNEMINYAIDLGTTNSLIAHFEAGVVEVLTNPIGFGETLPSVVGFRKDRILVGRKARELLEKDPQNVASQFKRKMGTTEVYRIRSLGQAKTPVELSAMVLKELRTFIRTEETPPAVVITVPACFDMAQANATKEAGLLAGFEQVVLLQEPIAASLAYANKPKAQDLKNSQWLVYDLGGGTFDVALVRIVDGEFRVVDHEGDNYLGGADFDALIVERLLVPAAEREGVFTDLLQQMTSASGRYNAFWLECLSRAGRAKEELSATPSAEIELELQDENGDAVNATIAITRSEFEALIRDAVDRTAEMLKRVLTRNSLRPEDVEFILMVGGSTYIPMVRSRVGDLLGIRVNTDINPVNAVAVGAAYFAGTREIRLPASSTPGDRHSGALRIRVAYNRASQECEELFSAKVEGDTSELQYRVTRDDGGFDTGLRALSARVMEELPLRQGEFNLFTFSVVDSLGRPVACDLGKIQIAQGRFSVAGQMLPEDLSCVLDAEEGSDTKLDLIFPRSTVLPARAKKTYEASRPMLYGSTEAIRIMVVEGPAENHFAANKTVGSLEISATGLGRDLLRGTEIDLTFELSESRDLTVTAYVNPSGPEFGAKYKSTDRAVSVPTLVDQVQLLRRNVVEETSQAAGRDDFELAAALEDLGAPLQELEGEALLLSLTPDDVRDNRFKLDDRARALGQEFSRLTAGKRVALARDEYLSAKGEAQELAAASGNDLERRAIQEIVAQEVAFLSSSTTSRIEQETQALQRIMFGILRRQPDFLTGWFQHLLSKRETLNDEVQAKALIDAGRLYITNQDFEKLAGVNMRLHDLLPQDQVDAQERQYFTGITGR